MSSVIRSGLIFLAIIYLNSHFVLGKEGNVISPEEAEAILKLRTRVGKHVTQEYMKDDHYLVRFLRAKRLNVDSATDMIMRFLTWRKDNKIDGILDEKFDSEKLFPYDLMEGLDGRPVGAGKVSDYYLRRYIVSGKTRELTRTAYKMIEFAMLKLREASTRTGMNFSTATIIGDGSGFNFREHACPSCIQLGLELFMQYEKYYPQTADKLIGVNCPRLAVTVYNTYKHILSEYLRSKVSIYGFDKSEWIPELQKIVAKEKLPTYLGGTYTGPRYIGSHRIGE